MAECPLSVTLMYICTNEIRKFCTKFLVAEVLLNEDRGTLRFYGLERGNAFFAPLTWSHRKKNRVKQPFFRALNIDIVEALLHASKFHIPSDKVRHRSTKEQYKMLILMEGDGREGKQLSPNAHDNMNLELN
ncbi:unnamed protein product [Lupinus luteus]|uniref:Uncharacterized protein n=1 Tax=Lupinus luteus TaxID=3873 RepID=A0AAV1VX98_LUPLU